jgi:hypothetical protein
MHLNGMLVNDGTETDGLTPILAPYEPESPDYVVEAKMRLIESYRGSFGVVVRANGNEGYAVGVGSWIGRRRKQVPNICYMDATFHRRGCRVEPQRFEPGTDLRTYRIEVKENTITFIVDQAVVTRVIDNKFLSAGRVGFWSNGYQVEVRSFRVLKL